MHENHKKSTYLINGCRCRFNRLCHNQHRPSIQNTKLSATGIGIGLVGGRGGIYPSISVGAGLGGGTKQAKTNTLAKLYGEHNAMVVAARQKGCAFAQHIKIYGE